MEPDTPNAPQPPDAEPASYSQLSQLSEMALRLDRGSFVNRFPSPWLVSVGSTWGTVTSAPFKTVEDATDNTTPSDLRIGAEARIWALLKRVPSFPGKIMLGRAPNNDVVLAHPSLSKLHSFFTLDGERVAISDAGSRNGTFVNDRRLEAMEATPLEDQDTIRLGADVRLLLMLSGTMHDAIQAGLMGAPPSRG